MEPPPEILGPRVQIQEVGCGRGQAVKICEQMGNLHKGRVGSECCPSGIRPRILQDTRILGCPRNWGIGTKRKYTFTRSRRPFGKMCYRTRSTTHGTSRVLLHIFRSSKEGNRQTKTCLKPKTTKPVSSKEEFQDGNIENSQGRPADGRLASELGPKRRIFTYSNQSRTSKVSKIQNEQSIIPMEGSSIRTSVSSKSIHKSLSSTSSFCPSARRQCVSIPRRLADLQPESQQTCRRYPVSRTPATRMRVDPKLGEVSHETHERPMFHRGAFQNVGGDGFSPKRKKVTFNRNVTVINDEMSGISESIPEVVGSDGIMHRSSLECSSDDETNSDISVIPLENGFEGSECIDPGLRSAERSPRLVVTREKFISGHSNQDPTTSGSSYNRCLKPGIWGISAIGGSVPGYVEQPRPQGERTYKSQRIGSSDKVLQALRTPTERQAHTCKVRQCHSCSLPKQTGGDKITVPVCENMVILHIPEGEQNYHNFSTYKRSTEFASRQIESSISESPRMASETIGGEGPIFEMGQTANRPIRIQQECTPSDLLFPALGPRGVPSGCTSNELGGNVRLCIPTNLPHTTSATESARAQLHTDSHSTQVAAPIMVHPIIGPLDRRPLGTAINSGPVNSVERHELAPGPSIFRSSGLASERSSIIKEGIPEDAADTIMQSIRGGTRITYDSKWTIFCGWCRERGFDPFTATLGTILAYLQSLLDQGLQYNTICVHRSSISRYHPGIDGMKVGQHPLISQFIRGVFNVRPPKRQLIPSWDLLEVLEVLRNPPFAPTSSLNLKNLTLKTIFLVAITSARRVSEIQALGRFSPFLRFEAQNVVLNTIPGFLSKTANPSNLGSDLILPCFCEHVKELCVKCTVSHYVKITGAQGCKSDRLFVAFGDACKGQAVTSRTIAGWIVRVIRIAYDIKGLPPPDVRAHSTRSAATSWGLFQKASLQCIIAAADWRQTSTFIKHYRLHIWKKDRAQFGLSVLSSSIE